MMKILGVPEKALLLLQELETRKRFEGSYIIADNDCWIWKAQAANFGKYGRFTVDGLRLWAHRVAWIMENGPIPEGLVVCHSCPIKACVRPDHLYLGTHKENMQDMLGDSPRGRKPTLTAQQVILIRTSPKTVTELAAELGASYQVVHAALYGLSWKHLAWPPIKLRNEARC